MVDFIPIILDLLILVWFIVSIGDMRSEIQNIIINQRKIMKHLELDYEEIKYDNKKNSKNSPE